MTAIIEATNSKGETLYYTGRAGHQWVSTDRSQAFTAQGIEYARKFCDKNNGFSNLHGLHFKVIPQ